MGFLSKKRGGGRGEFRRGAEEGADGGLVLDAGGGFDAGAGIEAGGAAVARDRREVFGVEAAGDGEGAEFGEGRGGGPVPGEAVAAGEGAAAAFDEDAHGQGEGPAGGQQGGAGALDGLHDVEAGAEDGFDDGHGFLAVHLDGIEPGLAGDGEHGVDGGVDEHADAGDFGGEAGEHAAGLGGGHVAGAFLVEDRAEGAGAGVGAEQGILPSGDAADFGEGEVHGGLLRIKN
jgi:hypothetical protein